MTTENATLEPPTEVPAEVTPALEPVAEAPELEPGQATADAHGDILGL